ncbi:MAG: serine hydrolase, partial [Crocinitomicaceae bacterium]
MKNTLILFLFSTSLMAFAQQSHPKFDSLANELVSNTTIPSVVFSYITPDTCLYGVAGVNNLIDKNEVRLSDKFSLGSNTKAITALIAMKMVEKGQITLDTKLLEVIPSLKKKIKKTYRKITLG